MAVPRPRDSPHVRWPRDKSPAVRHSFHTKPPPSAEMAGSRSSFSSVREGSSIDGLAQSFTQSRISSLDSQGRREGLNGDAGRYPESVIDDSSPVEPPGADDDTSNTETETAKERERERQRERETRRERETGTWFGTGADTGTGRGTFIAPLTRPGSRLHRTWYPAPPPRGLRSWKQITLSGRRASRSLEDMRSEASLLEAGGNSEQQGVLEVEKKVVGQRPGAVSAVLSTDKRDGPYPAAMAPIERLPLEILEYIIRLLFVELPTNGVTTRNQDLISLLQTSPALYAATIGVLYEHVTIPHSRIFRKFLSTIAANPSLGAMTRRLDFSHFNPSSLFGTASERARATDLTSETLACCLDLTVNLQEFLAQEHVDDDLGPDVLRRLFTCLPRMRALDFAGCSSVAFSRSLSAAMPAAWPERLSVTRLSLHKCLTLSSAVFDAVLPRCPSLTHLDVAATRVTDPALRSIPHTARLTHLSLAKCRLLSAGAVIDFVANHPAARSLVVLSLAHDSTSHELLDPDAVTRLLPVLPATLRSLSLKGSRMSGGTHLPLLEPLVRSLEELALGRHLRISDLQRLLSTNSKAEVREGGEQTENGGGNLALASTSSAPVSTPAPAPAPAPTTAPTTAPTPAPTPAHTIRYLDLTDLTADELSIGTTFNDPASLLGPASLPLEVVELAEGSHKRLVRARSALDSSGWAPREVGARVWLVRASSSDEAAAGGGASGHRWWKMGAESWGMRKIPVAHAEVGGMYGLFMFGMKL